jgi:hypothetical protein
MSRQQAIDLAGQPTDHSRLCHRQGLHSLLFRLDSHRYEAVYAGQGSVAYTGGGIGGGQGVLMMINYDPKIE